MFTQLPMATNQTRMPVIAALPVAYFVNGDTGLKQTTEVDWSNKYLNVEEIAAIVPIPEAVLDDINFDAWGSIKPLLENAIARTLDAAIFFGTNKPASWPTEIVTAAAVGRQHRQPRHQRGRRGRHRRRLLRRVRTVEADGFDVNGVIAHVGYRGRLRQARATTGESLVDADDGQVTARRDLRRRREVPDARPLADRLRLGGGVRGDFTQGILGVRQDITYKILDQAVITDATGTVVYNLPQQDMVALRVVFRFAWQVANTINYDQATEASRYPFASKDDGEEQGFFGRQGRPDAERALLARDAAGRPDPGDRPGARRAGTPAGGHRRTSLEEVKKNG
jgi:hypothetical protein